MKRFFIALIFLILCVAFGIAQPVINARVDKSDIHIGDRIELTLTVEGKDEVMFPEKPEDMGVFSLASSRPVKEGLIKPRTIGRVYVLSVYTTGAQEIPPVEVMYRGRNTEGEWQTTKSPPVKIEVKSLLTGDDTDIKDIKGLAAFGSSVGVFFRNILILAAVAGVIWALWQRYKRRFLITEINIKPADVIAHEELDRLKEMHLPEKGLIKEYYFRLSGIVRQYIEDRFRYRAPEMTTEEFMESIKRSSEIRDDHRNLLKDFLSQSDMVKFAKYGPTPKETEESFELAERFVDQTRRREEEGEE